MTNETTENFWKVFGNQDPLVPVKLFYRLYYDSKGCPLFYSMEDMPGNYIDIDHATYSKSDSNVCVKDGRLITLTLANSISKLIPNSVGTCCNPHDVCIVVSIETPHVKWHLKTTN